MTIDPFSPLKTLAIGACALVVGLLVGGISCYFVGRAHEAADRAESIGTLKTTVSSCTDAAKQAQISAADAKKSSDDLNSRLDGAVAAGLAEAVRLGKARSAVLQTPTRGATECERTSNMINDQFRSAPR